MFVRFIHVCLKNIFLISFKESKLHFYKALTENNIIFYFFEGDHFHNRANLFSLSINKFPPESDSKEKQHKAYNAKDRINNDLADIIVDLYL